ncbi:MAG TPA: DUF6786 family protein, partial [Mucilaginibacter sp.]
MKVAKASAGIIATGLLAACTMRMPPATEGSFRYDLEFLKKHDAVIVLKTDDGNARVIVSPKYQAKVFTSTAEGPDGKSFGWIKYETFKQQQPDAHMNAFGGEDRLWLGPEGGMFSLFFKPGTQQVFDNWHTPAAVDTESWELLSSSDKKVSMSKTASLQNYKGKQLDIKLERVVEILEPATIAQLLGISPGDSVKSVGFSTVNTISNAGKAAWD